jgi:CheY-like chemotaxis protein
MARALLASKFCPAFHTRDIQNERSHSPQLGTLNGHTIQTRLASAVPPGLPSTPKLQSRTAPPAKTTKENTETTIASKPHDEKSYLSVEAGKGLRILLVEDNAINLGLLRKFISRFEPQILHTAVEMVKEIPDGYRYILMGEHFLSVFVLPDAFMRKYSCFTFDIAPPTDPSMPAMDGFEATRRIRSIESKRNTVHPAKIIALTGGSSEHIKRAYAAGADVFLRNPFSFKIS